MKNKLLGNLTEILFPLAICVPRHSALRNSLAALTFCCSIALGSAVTDSKAAGFSREIVDHQNSGDQVSFSLSARAMEVSLQGLVENSGRWKNLATRIRPRQDLNRLTVPPKWRNAQLRVVATYPAKLGKRIEIPSQTDEATHAVVFTSTANARLFSVEARAKGSSVWTRVSTVAAPDSPTSIRVALPSSVAADANVRVMEVSGARKLYPPLKTPVSSWLRGGPSVFAASSEVVSALPFASVQADVSGAGKLNGQTPTVQESDIWKISGKKIYFFNRLRGLQIIDASDPADPLMSETLRLVGSGEEMYLLGSDHPKAAVLVTALPWSDSTPNATRLSRVELQGENPTLKTSLDLPGYYIESRLVGGLLQVVTASWDYTAGESRPKTFVTAVDVSQDGVLSLSNSSPTVLELSPAQVGSTGKYLWIAGDTVGDWTRHSLFAFPFKVDGSLGAPLRKILGGRILDKFKVGDTADGLAAVVQDWSGRQQITSVETYGEQSGKLVSRGHLELVRNESLFATRFDGDRLYAVTFQQKDPLWIVDLSDPAEPDIKGHLEVPGWSSFIQPVGDTLVAVGRDGGKVQVSLFDVSDEAKPVLAKRVDVGSGWSWSEAEWNEKAVKILPEAGLILIPVVEWDGGVRKNRVSLIDFDAVAKTLSVRGTIDHDFAPRRAALMDEKLIASVSNRELLLVDASNRDIPAVKADFTIAFGVDRVVVANGTALMFEDGGSWSGGPDTAVLRTAHTDSTDSVISQIVLPCRRVAAAEIFGDRMVVVETSNNDMVFRALAADDTAQPQSDSALSVWSLTDATKPALLGRVNLPFDAGSEVQILPVQGGRVAVSSRDRGWNSWVRPMPVVMAAGSRAVADALPVARYALPWLGWGDQSLHIGVADISGDAPSVVGSWALSGNQYSGISDVYSAGDLLAFSYDRRERKNNSPSTGPAVTWPDEWSGWSNRSWLQIVDLADPSAPMPWAPVQLPGQLVGISWLQRAGGVVFARSSERIAALGFDGENASLVAEIPVNGAFAMQGASLYAATAEGVSEWNFSEQASRWQQGPGWTFQPSIGIGELHVADGAVLAGAYGQAWVLGEDGSVSASNLPAGSDLRSAVRSGNSYLVPAGEYGLVPLP